MDPKREKKEIPAITAKRENEKMEIPDITEQQWEDRKKAKIFENLRDYFAYRAVFGEALHTTNPEFFINAIKILEEEIYGGEGNETRADL